VRESGMKTICCDEMKERTERPHPNLSPVEREPEGRSRIVVHSFSDRRAGGGVHINSASVATKGINLETLLRSAFLKTELAFLNGHVRFLDACDQVETMEDLQRLCVLAEKLLGEHERANPSAKQFRAGNRLPRPD